MMAMPATELPDGSEWSYEVKWDGYRAQAVKNGRSVSLASRNLKDITSCVCVSLSIRGMQQRLTALFGQRRLSDVRSASS